MSIHEWHGWLAYFHEPRGEERMDWNFASLMAQVVNMFAKNPVQPKEKLLKFVDGSEPEEQAEIQPAQQQIEMARIIELQSRNFGAPQK